MPLEYILFVVLEGVLFFVFFREVANIKRDTREVDKLIDELRAMDLHDGKVLPPKLSSSAHHGVRN